MTRETKAPKRRLDYTPPSFLIDHVDLDFDLHENATVVSSTLSLRRHPDAPATQDLRLHGRDIELLEVRLNDETLAADRYQQGDGELTITNVPDTFKLFTRGRIDPGNNKALDGLYLSSGNFCTQCEAEAFRKITFYLDRPDVMATFRTTMTADKAKFPVLLSNGNPISHEDVGGGRHRAVWEDPFKKPSYLFALVAGNLVRREDTFRTMSGREVTLHVYVEPGNLDQTEHCMASLKRSMAWDEKAFGREYDLDLFQIVAVGDFNMGAMENKGLNVFNTKFVLANPETATDRDYHNIEAVVGHEYFHNWSGNRVTCRDWFQLSLKEGFTVFRDQEFSADMQSRAVQRVADVARLRAHQFIEDEGPFAHPIRPDEYVEMNNFYTATVYEKGAEVVRMLQTLLGRETFREGCDLYFQRHDGQAVTCDDFVQAMADASGKDLSLFSRWYGQAGTPTIHIAPTYDQAEQTLALEVTQTTEPTPGQPTKHPLLMPIEVGLLDEEGAAIPLTRDGSEDRPHILELSEKTQTFTFKNVKKRPVLSALRGFSAPARLKVQGETLDDLAFLMAHDNDTFRRCDAGNALSMRVVVAAVNDLTAGSAPALPDAFVNAYKSALTDSTTDPALLALTLTLPSDELVADRFKVINVRAIGDAVDFVGRALAKTLRTELAARYAELSSDAPYVFAPEHVGRRALRNHCLALWCQSGDTAAHDAARAQAESANNMTDRMRAVAILSHVDDGPLSPALEAFYERYKQHPLVVDKWLALHAQSRRKDTFARVQELTRHEAFNIENPNKVRALVAAFAGSNARRFHQDDGAPYTLLADTIMHIDGFNPSIAARLIIPLAEFQRHEPKRADLMRAAVSRIAGKAGLSKDVAEMAGRALHQDKNQDDGTKS